MTTKATPSGSATRSDQSKSQNVQMEQVQETSVDLEEILAVIESLKKKLAFDRCASVKEKMAQNKEKMTGITTQLYNLSLSRKNDATSNNEHVDMLTKRQQDAIHMLHNSDLTNEGKNGDGHEEDGGTVLLGASFGAKNSIRSIKLKEVQKIPPYTTWVFLHRNQRMTEDQSVVGRRRIYYDQNGGEALICSDSEEEVIDDEEDKKDFVDSEDYILRMTIQEVGLSDGVLDSLAQCFSRKPSEVKARYDVLSKGETATNFSKKGVNEDDRSIAGAFLDKDLDAALDSFDNLFCRRCLVFDCRLHGCSQDLVFPAEKQHPLKSSDEDKLPCGSHCYRLALMSECMPTTCSSKPDASGGKSILLSASAGVQVSPKKKPGRGRPKLNRSETASTTARHGCESSDSEIRLQHESFSIQQSSSPPTASMTAHQIQKRNSKRVAERVLVCMRKRQKKMVDSDSNSAASGRLWPRDMKLRSNSRKDSEDASSSSQKNAILMGKKSRRKELPVDTSDVMNEVHDDEASDDIIKDTAVIGNDEKEEFVDENIYKHEEQKSWRAIEKSLFTKGVEIFGRNSCLIARNLLNGMKTCAEIFRYMNSSENKLLYRAGDGVNSPSDGISMGGELRTRSRYVRRRGKVRRLKFTWKNAAYHSIRKRITEGKNQPCRQYNPCGCQTACGKECTCLVNGTCCEKYCGCPKSCKNRFRGCHCAKSQCRSRQCPCFAANRECDPDVCRNCWVSCGDGSLGVPSQRGDNYECRNMKLLLKQQQRVLLGRSDVSGWGAFLKNSVGKHEYLGEYTGELISHREADKRGKIYDRENSSFLFNLNDQFVLDAYRKGDKLKFANHSPGPNCYAKVIMVAGDHRVGIYAKERINAGEELFYDYQYEPDRCPAWARKPEAPGSRKEETGTSYGRAKKLA